VTALDWRDRAPAMLLTAAGPNGEPCDTPADRRWLWRLENMLAVTAPMGSALDDLRRDLRQYLNETCDHHWQEYDGEPGTPIGAHRQCLWCNDTEWKTADGDYSAEVAS
jgi:hypothetical protein